MSASTNISYNGAIIATIEGSGTKTLNTQGKYCEGDITVQCVDSGGGAAPSGSITITENGTYDVADKASAVVALPYTYKRWVYTNPSLISDTQTITLLSDAWLAQHYDDTALEVMVTAVNPPQADDTATVYFGTTRARNVTLGTGKSYMQIITRVGGSTGSYSASAAALQGLSPSTRGMLRLNSSGELMLRVDSQCQFAAGDYEIVARLIP